MKKKRIEETKALKRRVALVFEGPFAKEVAVAGTFNDWNCRRDFLRHCGSGWWSIIKYLTPGIYEYRFIVDGI